MKALRLTLYTPASILLPIAYNELVQGMLYSCWHTSAPSLHDVGYQGIPKLRPFTFGRLEGKGRVNREARTISFSETLELEVRSPAEDLMDELRAGLTRTGELHIGAYQLKLVNLACVDRLIFPNRAAVRMRTPVVCYERRGDGHTDYLAPTDTGWTRLVRNTARYKLQSLAKTGLIDDAVAQAVEDLQVVPLDASLRKQVTRFKGTWVTGYLGDFVLSGSANVLALLWSLGIGAKGSQGFGMLDFIDRPL